MPRLLVTFALVTAWAIGATIFCAGNGMLGGFCGYFLRALIGYTVIIAFSHFVYLFLPRLGIGQDPRNE